MAYIIFFICHAFASLLTGATIDKISSGAAYQIENGIIYYRSTGNIPSIGTITLYFDQYGKRESVIVVSDMGDTKQKQIVIKLGEFQYMMMDSSQCIKANRKKKFALNNLDVSLLDEQSRSEYGVNKIGETFFLGRKCTKYSLIKSEKNIKGEFIVWENILLSASIENNGIFQKSEAFKIDTDKKIPFSCFEIPKGIEVLDMTSVNNN